MPSSTAARVAFSASSTRSFFSFTSNSVAPPTSGELCQPLLQLLLVVVRGGVLDLLLDLGNARLDVGLLAGAVDDRGVVLGDRHLLRLAKHVDGDILELDAEILGDQLAAGEHGDVLQHGLTAIAEPWRLDGSDFQAAAELVDHEGGKRFTLNVLGDDEQRTTRLHHRLEQRKQRLKP